MSYRLEIPYPEAEALASAETQTPMCLDGDTDRCEPYGPDDPVRLLLGAYFVERCRCCRRLLAVDDGAQVP
jgi:hypothetical protein